MAPKKVQPNGKAAAPKRTTAAKKPAAKKKAAPKKKDAAKFVRNIRNITVRATLESGRRIELKPRGERGDMASLTKEDVDDTRVIENIGMIWEILGSAEAQDILHKQATNQQVNPTAFDQLLNEYGKPYEGDDAKLEQVFEEQGEVVANVEDTGDGRFTQNNQQLVRNSGEAPEVVSPPGARGNEITEGQLDQLARDAQDGDSLRSALNVSVQPTQKEA